LIGDIDILVNLFRRVIIPQAVFRELQHPKTPQPVKDWIAIRPAWLEVKQADASLFIPSKKLGIGESEAISLAIELEADAVLIDDGNGTQEARKQNLIVLGTVNVLERAADKNLLHLPDAIDRLRQTSFRLPPLEIVHAMLERDRQRKSKS
jgi:predicted nucleic acid-binding protein